MKTFSMARLAASVALTFSLGLGAQAAEQNYVTGSVQGPAGEAVDGATVYICTGLVNAQPEVDKQGKTRIYLYYTSAKPGDGKCEGTGRTNREGKFRVRYPAEREGAALFVWKKLYEPIIVRDVKSPSDLGVVKLPGTNEITLMEKRNLEAKQKADKLAAENAAKSKAKRIEVWARHEQDYPGGILKYKGETITMADFAKANEECAKGNASGVFRQLDKSVILNSELSQHESTSMRVKGRILRPDGTPLPFDDHVRTTIGIGQDIQLDKATPNRWFMSNVVSFGSLYEDGNMDFFAPHNKKWDLIIWHPGFEPVIFRGATPPSDIGAIKLQATNADLKEIIRR